MMRPLNRLLTDDRGGALAEFLLGLVPLVIAFALIFEFGRAFWSHQAAIKGVRDATRFLTRVEDPSDPTAQAVAQRLLLTSQQAPGGVERWSSGSAAAMEVTFDDFDNNDADGDPVRPSGLPTVGSHARPWWPADPPAFAAVREHAGG